MDFDKTLTLVINKAGYLLSIINMVGFSMLCGLCLVTSNWTMAALSVVGTTVGLFSISWFECLLKEKT